MAEVKKSDKNYWLEILLENNPYERTKYYEALVYVRKNFMEVTILIFFVMILVLIKC